MANGDTLADSPIRSPAERFELKRLLGAGAMGMVYEAFDTARGSTVALKVLHRVEPEALFQFKAEFRALANLTHRNLLQLFELTTRQDDYVLSMELVDGTDFLSHVRSRGAVLEPTELDEDTDPLGRGSLPEPSQPDNDAPPPKRSSLPQQTRMLGELDETKLRPALRELAEGLHALHRSGRLHRDLKPANVLVFRSDERVVLCDFGLVTETKMQRRNPAQAPSDTSSATSSGSHHASKTSTQGTQIAGSLAFMSPEQAIGAQLDSATDWYAVGVMLYQALTGRVPLSPKLSFAEAVAEKQDRPARHPHELAPDAPADLAELAVALLDRDPVTRAGYQQVLSVLATTRAPAMTATSASLPPEFLIGRESQLGALEGALAGALAGHATVCFVSGNSGMGKSAIVRRFLSASEDKHDALVLRARCYECEELPYKVFDPLIDALSQHLLTLTPSELDALLPEDTYWLAALFPALRRVHAIAESAQAAEISDPFERKRRAFGAFRALCGRLAATRPLILYVDDLQWGDVDSGGPLLELLREPGAPPIAFVGAFRAEDAQRSPLLNELRDHHLPLSGVKHIVDVEVGTLTDDDARTLAAALLGPQHTEATVALLVKEAAGSPFFIRELATYLRTRNVHDAHKLQLTTVIKARVDALSSDARTLMDLLAVAGRPEARDVLLRASGLGASMFRTTQVLETQSLLCSTGTQAHDKLEPYHDRIRETLYQALGQERRQYLHRALAQALEASAQSLGSPPDAEALFNHYRSADERERACHFAVIAAERAQAALAFVRAAALYREAVSLTADGDRERSGQLEEKLGTALMFAGRGAEAAEAFLRAMESATTERATDLRAQAMTQLLGAGHLRRAFEELVRAEGALGMTFPRSNLRAIWMLVSRKLRMKLDDEALRVLPHASLDQAALRRVDDLYNVATALSTVDFLRGGAYTAEATLRALKTHDPARLACALAIESIRSAGDNKKPARTQWIIDRSEELARTSGEPYPLAAAIGTAGVSRYLEGRFREAVQLTKEAQQIHRERLKGARAWDYWTMVLFELRAAAEVGDLHALIQRVPETIRDAEERGDLYVKNMARVARLTWTWLAPDQLDAAREQVALSEREWVQDGYQLMHYYRLMSRTEMALYDGSAAACEQAWTELSQQWKPMSLVRKIQTCRVQALSLRARVALQLAKHRAAPKLLARARADASDLCKENAAWARALGQLTLGCVASFESASAAQTLLEATAQGFESEQLRVYAAVTRKLVGRLRGGPEGLGAQAQADAQLRAAGVVSPDAFLRMLAPSA